MTEHRYSLPEMSMINALGVDREEIWHRLFEKPEPGLVERDQYINDGTAVPVGEVSFGDQNASLPDLPESLSHYDCRNNRMALFLLERIKGPVRDGIERVDPGSFGIVVGTSTSGVQETERAMDTYEAEDRLPQNYDYRKMEMGGLAGFLGDYLDVHGPRYTISTSCSSSAKVFASARSLLERGICDAVLTGGVDTLSKLTLNGFYALQLTSTDRSNPMSENRDGINLGEGGALFLMVRDGEGPALLGVGESSDAHSMNAPDPEGRGAELSMKRALSDANLDAGEVTYVNLHGTGTRQNDAMEAKAVHRVFDASVPCSSTKPFTGHALGAAGAIEVAFCWMVIERSRNGTCPLPPHLWDGVRDASFPDLALVEPKGSVSSDRPLVLSNSFAFGGNNCSVLLGGGS